MWSEVSTKKATQSALVFVPFLLLLSQNWVVREKKKGCKEREGGQVQRATFLPPLGHQCQEASADRPATLNFLSSVYETPLIIPIFLSQTLLLKENILSAQTGSIHAVRLRHTLGKKDCFSVKGKVRCFVKQKGKRNLFHIPHACNYWCKNLGWISGKKKRASEPWRNMLKKPS